jgi:hypothetical protein
MGPTGAGGTSPGTGLADDAGSIGDGADANTFGTVDGGVLPIVLNSGSVVVTPETVDVIWSGEGCNTIPAFNPTDPVYVNVVGFEVDGVSGCNITVAYGGGGMPVGSEIVFPDEPLTVLASTEDASGQTIPIAYGVQSSISYPNGGWLTVEWDQATDPTSLIVGVPTVTFISLPTHNEDVVRVHVHVNLVDGRFLDFQVAPNLPPSVYQACPLG